MKKLLTLLLMIVLLLSITACSPKKDPKQGIDTQNGNENSQNNVEKNYENSYYENLDNAIILPTMKMFLEYMNSDFRFGGFTGPAMQFMNFFKSIIPDEECSKVICYPNDYNLRFSLCYGYDNYELFRIRIAYYPTEDLKFEDSQVICESFDEIPDSFADTKSLGLLINDGSVRYNRDSDNGTFYAVSIKTYDDAYFSVYLNTDIIDEHFDRASDAQKEFLRSIFPQYGATEKTLIDTMNSLERIQPDPDE